MDRVPLASWFRSRTARWVAAGLLTALALIAGSMAALDRRVLGHSDWGRDDGRRGDVVVLGPDGEPARVARDRSPLRRSLEAATGGTLAPSRRAVGAPPDDERIVRVEAELPDAAPVPDAPVAPVPPAPSADTDGDGLTDRLEHELGTDPEQPDTDRDALPDGWEEQYGLDPTRAEDAAADSDGDGLLNRTEFRVASNPRTPDTNDDGTPDAADDADGDLLLNGVEQDLPGADPGVADTDGDGRSDGGDDLDGDGRSNADELAAGTDPAVPDEPPAAPEEPGPA
ncbi:MAG TPA: hypothetical protein VHF89_20930, partial [Solirubrobacteraceae bacterium]|nr:hypothetical protein [Solirubrobacteraceae bacterium]